ncbi:MAG: hypothetical protein KIT72_10855 [Polyangiaceae bacterium]|nr:hypothetical protein [Polyangiaceae bacterium]MCW5790911.1 hypothetical protein [Polyangiaceae bacterium]
MRSTVGLGVWQVTSRLILVSLALLGAGCFRVSFVEAPTRAPSESHWQHHFLFGLVGDPELDARDVCPQGAAELSWSNGILTTGLTLITLGVYTPRELHVSCRTQP